MGKYPGRDRIESTAMHVIQRLSWFSLSLLLGAVFFLIVTPVGVMLRLCGWDPLRRRLVSRERGWVPCPERHQDPRHYERLV